MPEDITARVKTLPAPEPFKVSKGAKTLPGPLAALCNPDLDVTHR